MPIRAMPTPACLTVCLLAVCVLAGCSAPLPVGTAEQRRELAQLRYPADADVGEPLHVDVKRNRGSVEIINREPREYRNALLWVNQEYAGRLDRVRIGPGNRVPLNRFVNRHGEPFPTGSFLAPDDTLALISVEFVAEQDGQPRRRAMTVWPDKRWFED